MLSAFAVNFLGKRRLRYRSARPAVGIAAAVAVICQYLLFRPLH